VFCVRCGSASPDGWKFCHECGSPLVSKKSDLLQRTQRTPTEEELLLAILQTNPEPNNCHRCGANADLTRHQFAFAKVVSVKRHWGETLFHVGLSTVGIAAGALTGFGGISWKSPDKTVSYRLLKAELVLCRQCLSQTVPVRHPKDFKDEVYRFHPWAEKARLIGYSKYLSKDELQTLRPAK